MKPLLICLFCLASSPSETTRSIVGQASSANGKPLYLLEQKENWVEGDWTHRSVYGRLPGGKVIFEQSMTPGHTPAVPNITMSYNGSSKGFSVKWRKHQVVMSFTSANGDQITNTLISPPQNLVGPGGILAAIRAGWNDLRAQKTLEWSMIVPPKADAYDVRLVPRGISQIAGRETLRVRLEADSWIVRLVAPSTDFWIDTRLQSTVKYRGIGATDGPNGKPEEAVIVFEPPMLPVVAPQP